MMGKDVKQEPHFIGHRQRLRDRFTSAGPGAVADYEILELKLFPLIPRRDIKPIAKELLSKFGSLSGVMNASPERLREVKGLGENVIVDIKVSQELFSRMGREKIINKPVLSNWSGLLDYCRASMGHRKTEQLRVLYLDKKNILIEDELQSEGTVDHTPVYPREIVKRALELHSSSLILVHNHPSGNTNPSQSDISMTKQIVQACSPIGIQLHDHIIIGKRGHSSFRDMGLL